MKTRLPAAMVSSNRMDVSRVTLNLHQVQLAYERIMGPTNKYYMVFTYSINTRNLNVIRYLLIYW